MQAENEDHLHQQHQPRKTLNFNAPLRSTRRAANLAAIDLFSCPSVRRRSSLTIDDRIPFSWERAPGKPKVSAAEVSKTPRPKFPPGHHEDEDEDEDVFSLSEAIDIAERSEKKRTSGGVDGLRMKIMEDRSRDGGRFPDFIIQRFLPDAAALAEASLRERSTWEAPVPFSPKGCGLESVLFPWRGKHRLCGTRSLADVVRPFHPTTKHKRW